jgi:hypothetical protein
LIEDGSLIVTYMVPNNKDLQLNDDQREYLCHQNVEEITMGGKYVFTSKGKVYCRRGLIFKTGYLVFWSVGSSVVLCN